MSGMVDDIERDLMLAPIDSQERTLEAAGPCWRAPGVRALVSQLPFLRGRSDAARGLFVDYGALSVAQRGSEIVEGRDMFVVVGGIIKVCFFVVLFVCCVVCVGLLFPRHCLFLFASIASLKKKTTRPQLTTHKRPQTTN